MNIFFEFLFYSQILFFYFCLQVYSYESDIQHKEDIQKLFPYELVYIPEIFDLPILFLEKIPQNVITKKYRATHRKDIIYFRKVFRLKNAPYYIKIWGENYYAKDFFLQALKVGFFKEIAPLVGLIFDKNMQCRGYITKMLNEKTCVLQEQQRSLPTFTQNFAYQELFQKLLKVTLETGMIYIEFCPKHILSDDEGRLYIIDLEDVCIGNELEHFPISICPKERRKLLNTCIARLPDDYLKFLVQHKIISQNVLSQSIYSQRIARLEERFFFEYLKSER